MSRILLLLLVLPALVAAQPSFPERHQWDTITSSEVGFEAGKPWANAIEKLLEAINNANACDSAA